jgi:hypothetical protein
MPTPNKTPVTILSATGGTDPTWLTNQSRAKNYDDIEAERDLKAGQDLCYIP